MLLVVQRDEEVPMFEDKPQEDTIVRYSDFPKKSIGPQWNYWRSDTTLPLPAANSSPSSPRREVALKCSVSVFLGGLFWAFLFLGQRQLPASETRLQPPGVTLPGWDAKRNPAYLTRATHGAVAAENIVCSDVGVDVLKEGGNAVDAAVATTLCIGVVEMFSSGIGGGGFMTVRIPPPSPELPSEVWTIDFRETAPAAANSTMFSHHPESSRYGGLSIGVPGELRGLTEAHRRWGTLPWKRLVKPAAQIAEGWKIGVELSRRIWLYETLMLENPDWKAIFAPNGTLLGEGDFIRMTNYSRTLHTIAEEGAEAFYSGPILKLLLEKIHASGGILTAADFANYKPLVQPALKGSYKNRTVYTTHVPTSGPTLLHMLNLLELFKDDDELDKGLQLHRSIETLKFGFAARTNIFDPAFANATTMAFMNNLSTKKYAAEIIPRLTDEITHPPEYYNPTYEVEIDHGTSHSSIVDASGMAVSITSTINIVFGSQVLDPITGVIFNDELDDFGVPGRPNYFGLRPSPYNYPAPGKRPLSSCTPTILEYPDGSLYLVLGGAGGSKIFGSVAQAIIRADAALSAVVEDEDDGDDWINISNAVEGPRAHDQLYPPRVTLDSTFDQESVDALKSRGHNVTVMDINRTEAAIQAVLIKDGKIFAASDSRKNGISAGY